MGLRKNVALFAVGLMLALVLVLFGVERQILVAGFDNIERQFMQNSVQTFVGHMPFEYFDEVASRLRELAPQSEAYEFAASGDPSFVERYLTPERMRALNLSFVVFVDPTGEVLAVSENHADLTDGHLTAQALEPLLMRAEGPPGDGETPDRGLLLVGNQPAIVPSTRLDAESDTSYGRGTLVIGRVLDEYQVGLIEELTHLDIELRLWWEDTLTEDMRSAQMRLADGEDIPVIALDGDTIAGYTVLSNVLGLPTLLARVTRPRPVFAQAQQSQRVLLGSTALVGVVFVLITMVGLHRGLLARFASLSSSLRAISKDRARSARVQAPLDFAEVSGRAERSRIV